MIKTRKSFSCVKGFFLLSVMLFYILHARECTIYLREGLRLCAYTLTPAVFPHLVLCELALPYLSGIGGGILGRLASKVLCVRRELLPALLCGSFCGAPIGARTAASLARTERATKKELSVLAAFSNHTSPAFVIGGVGLGLFHSAALGVLLFFAELLSSLLCLALFMRLIGKRKEGTSNAPPKTVAVSLSDAVSRGGSAMISIAAVVLFFSPIVGFVRAYLGKHAMPLVLLLEVTNACADASSVPQGAYLAAFAIAFGGISVFMQSLHFLKETPVSPLLFLTCKLTSACVTPVFFYLLTRLPLF